MNKLGEPALFISILIGPFLIGHYLTCSDITVHIIVMDLNRNGVFHAIILWCNHSHTGQRTDLFRYIFDVCAELRYQGFEADSDPVGGLVLVFLPFGRSLAMHDKITDVLKHVIQSVPNPHGIKLTLPKI